jgi:flagellar hook-length control protein FliK
MGVGTNSNDSLAEPANSNATTSSRQTEVADRARLVHRISKAFQKMGVDGGHVRLKMHPEELGGVQLEMQVSGRTVRATVTAETEQARQVIQANWPELRQRLLD